MTTDLRAPLVPLALAFAAGIALGPVVPPAVAWPAALIALVWGASLVALDRPVPAAGCVLLGAAALGVLRAAPVPPAPDDVARLPLPAAVTVAGRLAAEPVPLAPDRTRMLLDGLAVDGEPRRGRLIVTVHGEAPPLTHGQRVQGPMRLHEATGFRNPGVFDHGAHLRRQGIHVVGSVRGDRLLVLDAPAPPWNVRLRRAARDAAARMLPPASAALLQGLLLGDRSGLPPELDDNFRRSGVYHILAVSGSNVALVAGAVFALAGLAGASRRLAAAIAAGAVAGLAVVVGPDPSVLRAAIMGVLVLGALIVDREASVLNSLALAAIVILAVRPGDLMDAGFQLTFAATAGIVLAPRPRGLVAGALAISLAAQLAVLPITLWHFNQATLVGPVANLAVVPVTALATLVGLVAVALSLVRDALAAPFFHAAWPLLLALRALAAAGAAVPGALLRLPAPHWTALVAYTLALALGLAWWRRRGVTPGLAKWAGAGALAHLAVALAIAAWPMARPADGRLRLAVLDVGQGDAVVLETPDGRTVVVDAGPGGEHRLDAGERVVAPYLWHRGVLRLSAAGATHADGDHAGGLAALHRHFAVREALPQTGRRWLGGASLLALAPGPLPPTGRRNDDALVLRVDHGSASFLLASDIGAETEAQLLASEAPVRALVLKVAHHGSRSSSTAAFLERVRPAFAVISVGARNAYGHPAPETLARLAAAGARIYRTDQDGAVLFETDGRTLTITRWAAGAVERYCLEPESACR